MQDVLSLLPHAKKDSKVESKQSKGSALNELVELRSCSSCLFFEVLLLYYASTPHGGNFVTIDIMMMVAYLVTEQAV